MWRLVRLSACSLFVFLGLASWAVDVAAAEPSESCRDLAARFATAPAQLDAKSLAKLGGCITNELGERAGAVEPPTPPEGAAPPPPPEPAVPPPAPGVGTSSPLARRYGDWPLPAPWTEYWPSPNPW
jgi:hypothetical protein